MEALRETLVAFYRWRGGTRERPSIAIVARPGDAQIGELRRLEAHFRQMGHETEVLVPDVADPDRHDLLYRHVWAHRTPPGSPFARALREPARWPLANPVNGLLEAKALFARLSEAAEDAGLAALAGLDEAERAAARAPALDPHARRGTVATLLGARERYVLKRSWDYGGKSVHLGAETSPPATGSAWSARRPATGAAAASWPRSGSSRRGGRRPASRRAGPRRAPSTGTCRRTAGCSPSTRAGASCGRPRRPS